jgi:hypothetical protein
MENFVKDVRYLLMPSRHPVKGYEKIYHEAYMVWRAAWEKFYQESSVHEPLSSDPFIIPDEIGVLMYQDRVVGLAAFTHGDLRQGTLPDHSWFKPWTQEAFNQLKNISPDCMVCSQFTISPEFTGRNQVVRWKEILFYFNHLRLINSLNGVMAGHLNLSRGMQNAGGEEFGGIVLNPHHEFTFHGIHQDSQLVAYTRESIDDMVRRKNIAPLFDQLWSKLENISDFPVTSNIVPFKKVA